MTDRIFHEKISGFIHNDSPIDFLKNLFKQKEEIYIYGAGKVAETLYRFLKLHYMQNNIKGFVVGDKEYAGIYFDKYIVCSLDSVKDLSCRFLIAISPSRQDEINDYLIANGIDEDRIIQLPQSIYINIRNEDSLSILLKNDERIKYVEERARTLEQKINKVEQKINKAEQLITLEYENNDKINAIYMHYNNNNNFATAISIVIPIFNTEKYIRKTLDSVLNQTFHNIEVICIDDGSTDASHAILKEYEALDKRIRIISQENKGLSAARNMGYRQAKGEYIYFLDSDDWIEPQTLSVLYNKAEKESLDILYFDGRTFYDDEKLFDKGNDKSSEYYRRMNSYSGIYTGEELFLKYMNNGEFRASSCLQLIRRIFLIESGCSFPEGLIYEDNVFTFETMLSAQRVGYLPVELFNRRIRQGSITTADKSFMHVYSRFRSYLLLKDWVQSRELSTEVRQAAYSFIDKILFFAQREYHLLNDQQKILWQELAHSERSLFQEIILECKKDV